MTRTCIDCPAPISTQSQGRCRSCAALRLNRDPGIINRRNRAIHVHFEKPGVREASAKRLAEYMANMPEDERKRRRENGHRLFREVLSRPDVRAKSNSPEAKRKAGEGRTNTVLAWCPPDLRGRYRDLIHSSGLSAAEARQLIEAEIPGTVEHARRNIANRQLAQQLKHARDRAQSY